VKTASVVGRPGLRLSAFAEFTVAQECQANGAGGSGEILKTCEQPAVFILGVVLRAQKAALFYGAIKNPAAQWYKWTAYY